jgi:hypothetical protein
MRVRLGGSSASTLILIIVMLHVSPKGRCFFGHLCVSVISFKRRAFSTL